MNFVKKYGFSGVIGALAGLINGLLGAGGGIIITYYLAHILSNVQKAENGVFANAVATMLPVSAVSLVLYLLKGYISIDNGLISLLPSALIGGILGAFLLTKLNVKIVKIIFAFLVTISGIMMVAK